MFEGARRPSLMARNAAIHAGKLPKNIVAVLFIINLVIELLRGISRYLDLRKVAPVGFSILSNVYIFIMHTNTHFPNIYHHHSPNIHNSYTPGRLAKSALLHLFTTYHHYLLICHMDFFIPSFCGRLLSFNTFYRISEGSIPW